MQESLAALAWLQAAGCRQMFQKYCSTFDSTDEGNIGPVADVLVAALGCGFAIACPAFPANARTVYQGHLFVGYALLSESGMQDHPLTPMRDSNLVRVLSRQTDGTVGLVPFATVARGAATIRSALCDVQGAGPAIRDRRRADGGGPTGDWRSGGRPCAGDRRVRGGDGIAG